MREIVMPKSSMTMTEGELVKWVVAEGDEVQAGDPVAEIMTDKVEMEVEAPEDGRMGILVEAGRTVDVGTTIGVILGEGEQAPNDGAATAPQPPAREDPVAADISGVRPGRTELPNDPARERAEDGRLRASPAARKMAKNRKIDLAALRGSGPKGRITTDDVAAASNSEARGEAVSPPRDGDGPGGVVRRERPTGVRGAMARRMGMAASIPQFTLFSDVSFAAAERARRELSASWDVRLSITHLIVRATAVALQGHGELNAHWIDNSIERFADVNIGVAMATDAGLIVPVL
ncbi:MAG: 2-oxo acid dehydrogenase subunit E2, partial [Actinomycetota bacterium]|nr:2-oxo acid dehydrogenase subunit E2 [Actinomycetota bacterium]